MAHHELLRLVPSAPRAVCDILDSARGPVEPPIRSEIFGPQRFAQHGRSLGETHRAARSATRQAAFFPRLRSNVRTLREAHRYIGSHASTGYDISPAAEWLLDNFHLIEAQLKEIHEGLPRSYFRSLPTLLDEPLAGLPRVYGVAWAFVAHTDGAFDEELLAHFLIAYQETRELNLSEMWALPTTLRVVLIENLRRLAERVATNKAAREVANLVCDDIDADGAAHPPALLDTLLALLNRRGVGRVFLAQMAQRLQDGSATSTPGRSRDHVAWLRNALPDLAAVQTQQPADQAADNLSVSNAVTSLRAIGDADWPDIVSRTSTLMQLMLGSQVFEAEHVATRDQTLHGIETLARRSGRSEVAVAQTLLGLMRSGTSPPTSSGAGKPLHATEVASHWLRGPGRPALVHALGLRDGVAALAPSWRAMLRRVALPAYLGTLLLGTLGVVAWMLLDPQAGGVRGSDGSAAALALSIGMAALMLFPASEAVVAVINRLIGESARPRHLPRLALAQGIPAEHRVMVVIPALLTDAASITALAHRLLLHHLANPERHAQFALLTDWADADTAQCPTDATLLAEAQRQIKALNARYPATPQDLGGGVLPGAHGLSADTDASVSAGHGAHAVANVAPRFILLHRQRVFSDTEQRWIGWERKRGKLERLIAALATGSAAGDASGDDGGGSGGLGGEFIDLGSESRIAPGTRYVVTLDSDTQLPPGRLRDLVGVAAHPNNRPQLDDSGRAVRSGYAILQPRVATPLPAPRDVTLFHWLFAGQCGIDPYSAASSEVYQDMFGEGTFTGKGLLDVQAVHAVLGGRLPEGQVLSHDLLEGSLARCAAVTDITVIEDAPFHADVAASRVHRWTRGDWQLLPFLVPFLLPFQTPAWRWRLRAINRWKMFDNLRRSLVAPMSLALLLLALAGVGVSPGAALVLVFAAFSAGPLMGAVAGLSPSRDDIAKRHFYRRAVADLARAAWGGLWHVAQLLQAALLAVDAVVRALYRMLVSRRHLLQWTTAAAAQASARTEFGALLKRHRSVPAVALVLLAALFALGTPHPAWTATLCLLWAASPVWTWWVSGPRPARKDASLPAQDQTYLEGVARDTWRLFERCVVAEERHLPPDNLQTAPHDMVAHRTSPTNIGLYLLSVACARRFGWITTDELLARMEATLASVATLQRHRGHLLNWYDTQTGAPLLPMYVSTVDSGNLSGHLLAVGQACLELAALADAAQDDTTTRRLQALAEECERLAWLPDFSFLYHRKRHLFHIGFRVAEQQLDVGFYDLLASESRLTSLLAIAKGDVPVSHWASLGRPFFAVGSEAGLRSWSGSMFEYLMPTLVLDEPQGSVLRDACSAALHEQIAFADAQGIPWGLSESAYAGSDHTLAYQYSPQGVPRLALRRTPPDELVVAPYATALAAQIAPHRARLNFKALEQRNARGPYGFIEALDFTPTRQAGSAGFTPVFTFMAHHQGMTIVALANVLLGGVAQRWGMANPHIEAVASLLHERAPREVSMLYEPPPAPPASTQRRAPGLLRDVVPGEAAVEPTHLLGNGRYSVSLRANGAGWSRWGATGITRWRDDALRDALGSFFYIRRPAEGDGGTRVGGITASGDRPRARADAADASSVPARLCSLTQHPSPDAAAHYQSSFHADRVCFDARWPGLQAHTTVWVSPEDDIEFRRVELHNLSDEALEIELISAFEVTLSDPRADEAHPAFTNLFVRAEWRPAHQALVFERTPRLPTEQALRAAHFIAESDPQVLEVRVQTDRQRWLGRNHAACRPLASFDAVPPATAPGAAGDGPSDASVTTHTVLDTGLDPVCAMAVRLRIAPSAKAQLTFATAASDSDGTLRAVIDKYCQPSHVQRASLMSATLTGIRLRTLRVSAENFAALQSLTTALVLSLVRPQANASRGLGHDGGGVGSVGNVADTGNVCDKRLLWRFGISGDRPIVLVSAGVTQGLGLLRTLAQGLRLWSWGGVACDVVVVNAEPASYLMALQRDIVALGERHAAESGAEAGAASHGGPAGPATTGFHVLRADELSADELSTLHLLARVRFNADGRPLLHHLQEWTTLHEQALQERQDMSNTSVPVVTAPTAPAVTQGQFAAASGEFRFDVGAGLRPQRPWINVLSNPGFGAQISEAGGGYTWAVNSRLNQLTAWSNDPVGDPPSELFLLQDLRTLQVWSAAPSAWGDETTTYRVAHGQGYSVVSHRRGDVDVTASWCVDPDAAVKQVRLRVVNRGHRTQQLRIVGIAEWMMGANRSDRGTVHTALFRQRLPAVPRTQNDDGADARGRKLTALLATQREQSAGFGGGTAFLALTAPQDDGDDWTCDRRECFDARGRPVLPDHFGNRQGAGLDPCAALSTRVVLAAGESAERVFLLGHADNADAARQLAVRAAATPALQRLEGVRSHWDTLLGATTVKTPDPLFDAMVNRWLLYQVVSCRLWAKAGFYQAGGATGFRDQLQDAMALAWADPSVLRRQIVLCASRQFAEGDVQHWWHAPLGNGVRTHFSDDLLWLAHACVHYLHATGDATLLDETVPFLEGAGIPDGAEDAYFTPATSPESATVFEHAARAIDRSLRVGAHGLPLMGSGDWNDGMNRVGIEGRGESVWLGWFLCKLVADFSPVARERGDAARALRWERAAVGWKAALNGAAWDGQWFKRAFFDDGQALGSHNNAEARIDLIAQAWAVLSGAAQPALQRLAMAAVDEHLVDPEAGLLRLLHPPLARAVPSAGYIQAYPAGVRENGGQYSHAGVWALMAQASAHVQAQAAPLQHLSASNRGGGTAANNAAGNDTPYRWFTWLSPAHRARHATHGAVYGIEPYVMAGDVYSHPPHVGRGGWSWYTGAAAWLHRAAIESLFGLSQRAQTLCFAPCLPTHWPRAELALRRDGRTLRFVFVRTAASAAREVCGAEYAGARLLLPGETLHWAALQQDHAFIVPLLADDAGAATPTASARANAAP
ncbi:MAG: carbohydrate-binding protein [Methylibium sp. NZG]|nr:MAG: carbohydrate-binding protein [Methylibium sp. NZG]